MSAMPPTSGVNLRRTDPVCVRLEHHRDELDYHTIGDVAAKLPEKVIQEYEKFLIYYDIATMRLGV